jgi:hypothetical protein
MLNVLRKHMDLVSMGQQFNQGYRIAFSPTTGG